MKADSRMVSILRVAPMQSTIFDRALSNAKPAELRTALKGLSPHNSKARRDAIEHRLERIAGPEVES